MTKFSLLLLTCCLISSGLFSQVGTYYIYDNAGNRTGYYVVKSLNQANDDNSAEALAPPATEDEEDKKREVAFTEPKVAVFPNPTSGLITIKWDEAEFTSYILRIVSDEGRVINEERVNKPLYEYDIRNESSGTYVIYVQGSGQELSWQVIKK